MTLPASSPALPTSQCLGCCPTAGNLLGMPGAPQHRVMEAAPPAPHGLVLEGVLRRGLQHPMAPPGPRGRVWPPRLPTPGPAAPDLLGHSASPQTGWTGCRDGASRGQRSPQPVTGRVTTSKGQGLRMARLKPAPGHIPPALRGHSPDMAPTGFGGCKTPGSLIVGMLRPRTAGTSLGGVAGGCGQPRPSV